MDDKIVALIPVREGSQRVKNKNFKPFATESSLMHLKIRQLKEADCFDAIYVSSDSDLAKEIAESEGIEFLYRDPYMCGHDSRLYEYNNYMLNTIPGNPVVAWTMVTAPLYEVHASSQSFSVTIISVRTTFVDGASTPYSTYPTLVFRILFVTFKFRSQSGTIIT